MSKFIGKGATINNPDALTHGKPCIIVDYIHETRKYMVDFDGGWTGWYRLRELVIEDDFMKVIEEWREDKQCNGCDYNETTACSGDCKGEEK